MGVSPDLSSPDGAATAGGLAAFAAKDEQTWKDQSANFPVANAFNPIGWFSSGLLSALQGVFSGGVGFLATISDLFALRWAQADQTEEYVGDLQDRTQNLEGVIGHGSAYMPTSPGATTSPERMPFGTTEASRVGPQVGVEWLGNGRVRLLSRGLWDVFAQVEFWGGTLMPPETFMDIMVRDPAGTPFYRMKAKASTVDNVTVTNITSFTVPDAGYTVEILAWTGSIPLLGSTRGIRGGLETTRLNVRKISQETS